MFDVHVQSSITTTAYYIAITRRLDTFLWNEHSDEYEYREPLSTGITTSSSKFVPPPIEEDNFSPDEDTTEYPHEILPPLPKCNTSKIERKKSATVEFDEVFNENLCFILNNIRHNSALQPMMLTTTLLPSVAHLCQHAFTDRGLEKHSHLLFMQL
ncbi:unnamed protein product [Didymodactylos carnosus]|uniref:Uncharacterized protein n=1 Tax=Didymodactylos carnosus TaxID=1234261 RepID=A0A814IJW9_9BILA|nr:unnamed protein product [Didymodactylos carnosus]CAF1026971.1 unnamed protein product [Didymodactylos carnosus]CAF3614822.1 unnamed protein product [Didymodactylos carnosus]CAF3798060.1 unnamed protein product [Didymodactylos carnosus]